MYEDYQQLLFERHPDGVLLITMNSPETYNSTDDTMHAELARVWNDVDRDPDTAVAVITGAGKAFSAGGDFSMLQNQTKNYKVLSHLHHEVAEMVYNVVRCQKPIIAAINGVAVGAGLSVALMSDISIMAEDARLTDGHLRLGVAAGDHAAMIWPLLCGMAKAKYYLLTSEFIDGKEAERIGLVSRAVPREEVLTEALAVARRIGSGPQAAVRWTKRSLNLWLTQAAPIFEASLALEMLNFFDDDVEEGLQAIQERRAPSFPSAAPWRS